MGDVGWLCVGGVLADFSGDLIGKAPQRHGEPYSLGSLMIVLPGARETVAGRHWWWPAVHAVAKPVAADNFLGATAHH